MRVAVIGKLKRRVSQRKDGNVLHEWVLYGRMFFFLMTGCLAVFAEAGDGVSEYPEVIEQTDVAPVWSVHRIGSPVLLTHAPFQYVGYYDADRYLTVAQRRLDSEAWQFHRFPIQMGWPTGGHAKLTLAVDRDGFLHVSSYRRGLLQGPPSPPAILYYRSEKPHDIGSFERLQMVSPEEDPGYPTFITGPDGTLYFEYRQGSSGRGDQIYNVYDPDTRNWQRLLDVPLLDGRGLMNAYGGPRFGPDGMWHAVWVWRNTPCNSTNHTLSYARSPDMRHWQSIDGQTVTLPMTSETESVIVDPVGPGQGLSNMTSLRLGWDSRQRTVHSYHKYDDRGNSQIFNARFQGGRWLRVRATEWDFLWDTSGTGALPYVVRVGAIRSPGDGRLEQVVWSQRHGSQRIILDEAPLTPVDTRPPVPAPAWRRALSSPESDFRVPANDRLLRAGGRMRVQWINDQGGSADGRSRYLLRWENAGGNNDRPVPEPWPAPTMLRVLRIEAEASEAAGVDERQQD